MTASGVIVPFSPMIVNKLLAFATGLNITSNELLPLPFLPSNIFNDVMQRRFVCCFALFVGICGILPCDEVCFDDPTDANDDFLE